MKRGFTVFAAKGSVAADRRHTKLHRPQGYTFPLSASEYNPSTQPFARRAKPPRAVRRVNPFIDSESKEKEHK